MTMIATKTYPWGSIRVEFTFDTGDAPQLGSTLLAIMNAHTSIQKTLDMLAIATAAPAAPAAPARPEASTDPTALNEEESRAFRELLGAPAQVLPGLLALLRAR